MLFAVLLVFAQQEAMLHPYEHTTDWQQTSSDSKKAHSHSEVCGKCIALAHFESAVGSKLQLLHVPTGKFEQSTTEEQLIVSGRLHTYFSRAPPCLA